MNTSLQKNVSLVNLSEIDIPSLIKLSSSVGWDYDEHEIRTIMLSGEVYGHKNLVGEIISSAAIIPYDTSLASIGMVIVNQDYRGMGLGEEVTQACVTAVSTDTTTMLIATEKGKPLYEKMGFKEVDCVHKFLCDQYASFKNSNKIDSRVREFRPEDFERIIDIDKKSFGDSRRRFLVNRIEQSQECLVISDEEGSIMGYGLSVQGPENLVLGPIVAPNNETSLLLLHRLANNHVGRLRIDVPSGNEVFMNYLKERGFNKVSQPPIMINKDGSKPRRDNSLYGIAAQAFG